MSNHTAIWTPSQQMASNEAHTAQISGTVQDPNGDARQVDFSNWGFTTANDATFLYQSNFNQFDSGANFTSSQLEAAFGQTNSDGSGFGAGGPADQRAFWREDPEGKRGTVMMMRLEKGKYAGDGSVKVETRIDWEGNGNNSVGVDEVWMAYDVYFSPNYKFASGHKMPGMMAYGEVGPGGATGLYNACRYMCDGALDDGSIPRPNWPYSYLGKGTFSPFIVDAYNTGLIRHFNKDDPTVRINSNSQSSSVWQVPRAQWVRIKMHLKMNDVGQKNGIAEFFADNKMMWTWASGVEFRIKTSIKWNLGYFTYFWGGGTTDWRSPNDQDQEVYVDNFSISETDPG